MSGLEVLGVVASILQIADLGAKLSVKLCTFYRTVKVANQSMQELSCDVSLTCSILNELAKTLEQDDQAKLCSEQAFRIAQEVLKECKAVFQQIENGIEKHTQDGEKSRFARGARKVTIALLGPNFDVLKSNLERLKSTTLLMLHVIMYAGELRKRKVKTTLTDQRNLIQTLLEEKKANNAKFNQLSSIQAFSVYNGDGSRQESSRSLTDKQPPPLSVELRDYHTLVQRLLYEIDACQHSLEQNRHLRIRNGLVNVHSAEAVLFQHTHGHAATQIFDDPLFKFRDACSPDTVTNQRQSIPIRKGRNTYSRHRESEYDIVRRSEADEDPYYYHRHPRVHEYDYTSRRKLDPDGSISQASSRGGNRDQDYSSDDSMVYIRKETRDYDDQPHHRRHLAEGALVGASAAELLRSHSKKDGEVSHGASRIGKTVGAGALGAVAVNAASRARDYYRSKSRHRSHSFEDDRSSHRHGRHGRRRHSRSRSRSRSYSHSRAKTLLELGVGAAAVAAGVAALRSKSKTGDRKGRSRTRSRSRAFSRGRSEKNGEEDDSARSMSERRKHMAGAGLAGAAVTNLVEEVRSHSRSRSRSRERSRSKSRFRLALPIVGAGLPTAAAVGLPRPRMSAQFQSLQSLLSRDMDSIPAEHYYGQPVSPDAPYDAPKIYGRHSQHKDRKKSEERIWSSENERKEKVSRKRFRSCSDNDDASRGRSRTRLNEDLLGHAVSDTGKTSGRDGQPEEGSSHKCRRMKSPNRELRTSAEHDKANFDATLAPQSAKKDPSLPMEETLESLVLQWTNLTREEMQTE